MTSRGRTTGDLPEGNIPNTTRSIRAEDGRVPDPAQVLLDAIPEGKEYDAIRNAVKRIASTFPDELGEITAARLAGWIDEVDRGDARDADDIRDDIFRVIVGRDVIMDVLGVSMRKTADALIKGGNDGGMNFSDLNIVHRT